MDPISDEFTIARWFDSPTRIGELATAVDNLGPGSVSASRKDIDAELTGESLGRTEAEALLVGLVLNDAAETAGRETPIVDATYEINTERARAVLEEQSAACLALNEEGQSEQRDNNIELVATVPPQLNVTLPPEVGDLDTQVRSALLSADIIVRIANPYFDPEHPTIKSLRTLPQRGVETRILTRDIEPETDRYEVLSEMRKILTPRERDLVDVSELFALDDTGRQAYATHAKLVIVDDTKCYLGSANFTVPNLTSNFEIGVLTSGSEVSTAATIFDTVFEASQSITLPE